MIDRKPGLLQVLERHPAKLAILWEDSDVAIMARRQGRGHFRLTILTAGIWARWEKAAVRSRTSHNMTCNQITVSVACIYVVGLSNHVRSSWKS